MRIISGEFRSLQIKTLSGSDTRPTLNRVKQAVFNHLGNLKNCDFLDLFSGSGAIGIEAISKGAKNVVFNDSQPLAHQIIIENLTTLKVSYDKYRLHNLDALFLLEQLKEPFDFIYLDPPFNYCDYSLLLDRIVINKLLKPTGELVVESNNQAVVDCEGLIKTKEGVYGKIKITYFTGGNK